MLKQGIQKFLSMFGYRLLPLTNMELCSLERFFPLLKRSGFAPKHIWDVGANHGNWTRAAIGYFPDAEYTLIEPQDALKAHVQDLIRSGHKILWISAGAGNRAGTLPLYVATLDHSSSFLDVPRIKEEAVQRVEVPMRTLNEIRTTSSLPVPEMLKVDAEGLDLRVLEGATDLLGHTEIVLAEGSIGQLDFENMAGALIDAMDDYGYRLVDITDVLRSPNSDALWLCEFAFLLKSSGLLKHASRF
jgi:FkbM family methyltransferase